MGDRLHIALLSQCFCLDGSALGRDAQHIFGELSDALIFAAAHQINQITDLLLVDDFALGCQSHQSFNGTGSLVRGLLLAGDFKFCAAVGDIHLKGSFNLPDVFIERTKHADQLFDPLGVDNAFCHGSPS